MTMAPMLPRERGDFSAIVDRPPLRLPGGARLVVWTIVNYEVWDIARPMPRQVLPAPTGQALLPDVPQLELARIRHAGRGLAVLRICSRGSACGRRSPSMPASARTIRASPRRRGAQGWEFMGHGYVQMPMHMLADQPRTIQRSSTSWSVSAARARWAGSGRA